MRDRQSLIRLALRFGMSYAVSIAITAWGMHLVYTNMAVQPHSSLVVPVAIVVGLLPLVYWYRRNGDWYPVALAYSITAYFALRACVLYLKGIYPGL
jgi:uncharacterized membrane protein